MKDFKFIFYFILNLNKKKESELFVERFLNKSFFSRWIKFFSTPVAILKRKKHVIQNISIDNKIWFCVDTINQYNSLKPIYDSFSDISVIVTGNYSLYELNKKLIHYFDFYSSKFILYKYPFYLFNFLLISISNTFKFIDYFSIHFGIKEGAINYIKKYRPKALIFANDHNPFLRAFLLGSLKCNVPSVYIQHASISHLFPPLSFTYSLLDGKDSLKKYQKIHAISGEVVLVGIPKFDQYISFRRNIKQINNIGIGYNTFDDLGKIYELVNVLSSYFSSKKILLRPHPSDTRKINIDKFINVFISDSITQNSFDFLSNVDLLVCGDSSLHLEANMLNRPCLYYRFTLSSMFDYYGYLKHNIMIYTERIENIIEYIDSYQFSTPSPYIYSKYFNEAILSDFEGKSSDIVKNYLSKKFNLDE